MSSTKGWYSVVQFCPDPSRAEAANVGVLLFCPERGFVEARAAKGGDRVRRFFGKDYPIDLPRLEADKRALCSLVKREAQGLHTVADLVEFIDARGGKLTMTAPREMRVEDPRSDLEDLFAELVGSRAKQASATSPVAVQLRQAFVELQKERSSVQIKPQVEIPGLAGRLSADYGYQNGTFNLVKFFDPKGTPAEQESRAFTLAGKGGFLQRHSEETDRPTSLVVVSGGRALGGSVGESELASIFGESDVAFVTSGRVGEFIDRVRSEAK